MSHNQAAVHHVANTCQRSQPNDAVTWPPIIRQAHRLQIVAETASLVRFGYLLAFVRYIQSSSRRLGASLSYGGSAPGNPTVTCIIMTLTPRCELV